MNAQNQPGYTFEETDDTIKFSIRSEKDWLQYLLAIVSLLSLIAVIIFIIVSIINLLRGGVTPDATLDPFFLFLISSLVLFGITIGARQSLYNAFLLENIEITERSITIEKSGFLRFRGKKVIPVARVKGISLRIQLSAQKNSLGDLLLNTSKIGKLLIITRQRMTPIYPICRGISTDEVILIVDKILIKFPQYKYL